MRIAPRPSCGLTLAALLSVAAPAMAQVVDTGTPPIGPNPPIFTFGRGASSFASIGQSFTVPVGSTQLDAFTFWLRDNAITGNTPYYAYIFDWDPATRRTGSSYLFRSAAQNYTGVSGPTAYSFATGGLDVVGGDTYLAALSTVEFPNAPIGFRPGVTVSSNWPNDVYTGGASYVRTGPAGLANITGNPRLPPSENVTAIDPPVLPPFTAGAAARPTKLNGQRTATVIVCCGAAS